MEQPLLVDTHCHLDDPSLYARLPEVINAAHQSGVNTFIIPGVGEGGWAAIADLADGRTGVHPAFGLHPMNALRFTASTEEELLSFLPKAVAIGEIGLDYLLTAVSRETQIAAFRNQLRIAVQAGLPVLIHCRKAFQDMLRILREEHVERIGGIMHAFSGSPEIAWECIRLGLFISIAGPVTYPNAVRPVKLVHEIPLQHLVLETDAPDMTPEPWRSFANEPAFLLATARKVAELKSDTLENVAMITSRNAQQIFRLPPGEDNRLAMGREEN